MNPNKKAKVGEKNYQPDDYKQTDELSKGLAETHEQAIDTLKEGYNEEAEKKDF
ncbi:YozQ family protein [Gracilibacillus caseinilyticus]|uniref:YozQ family protein n=1 Tax=Gracilibacillus caseinilyticus TaxID=2932256 RepID=A0ABY4ET49_9BACI|nr:YozQ family protein [Gracilibacillus caseinilyticus]UOQ47058.1 YozQ family protein [Gracilibacillus caseinilyticus]